MHVKKVPDPKTKPRTCVRGFALTIQLKLRSFVVGRLFVESLDELR